MKRHNQESLQGLTDDLRSKQDNLIWPNALVNQKGVDAFLLNGSLNPTPVKRVAAWLMGVMFMAPGMITLFAWKQLPWFVIVLALGTVALGIRIFINGCRARKP